jgi:TRAP transporter TAXI family solute receptor
MKKRIFPVVLSLALLGTFSVGVSSPGAQTQEASISFSTSGMGGTFYVAGTAIASLVSSKVKGLKMTAEVTKGVVENARLLATAQTDIGFLYGSTAYNLTRGLKEFKDQKYTDLRALVFIHTGALNFVTLEKTGIKTLDDLSGKKVSIGPRGSGSAAETEDFLRTIGLFEKIDIRFLSFNDSAASLRDGHIDAFVIGGTTPVPVLLELEATQKVVFIPVDPSRIKKFLEARPYHVQFNYPLGVYKSVTKPLSTVGYAVILGARKETQEWVIYEMLKTMFSDEGKKYLVSAQKAFQEMAPGIDYFKGINLPLHSGADKYYKESGLMK